jgi:hypothetical protein
MKSGMRGNTQDHGPLWLTRRVPGGVASLGWCRNGGVTKKEMMAGHSRLRSAQSASMAVCWNIRPGLMHGRLMVCHVPPAPEDGRAISGAGGFVMSNRATTVTGRRKKHGSIALEPFPHHFSGVHLGLRCISRQQQQERAGVVTDQSKSWGPVKGLQPHLSSATF